MSPAARLPLPFIVAFPALTNFHKFRSGRHVVIGKALPQLALVRIDHIQEVIEAHAFLVSYCVAQSVSLG
jgi:hypothetical protein